MACVPHCAPSGALHASRHHGGTRIDITVCSVCADVLDVQGWRCHAIDLLECIASCQLESVADDGVLLQGSDMHVQLITSRSC
jgi:Zn ribbon nucleic-acid-binding protein